MRRLSWILVGVALAVVVLRRLGVMTSSPTEVATGAVRQIGARAGDGVTARVGEAIAAVRDFGAEVRSSAAEREVELRAAVVGDDPDAEPTAADPTTR